MKQEQYFALSPRIAKWKLNSSFENWLSYKADSSEFWKRCYMDLIGIGCNQYDKCSGDIAVGQLSE